MSFCTKCGHKNSDENRFCEECGAPLKAANPPGANSVSVPPPVATLSSNGKRGLLYAGIAISALIIAGGGAYYALRAEQPSNELFATLIEQSVAKDASVYKTRFCLTNFAYDKNPVLVNPSDSGTKDWLAILTKAGLYSEPVLETNQSGFFIQEHLKYEHTDAGKKAIQGRSLCIADGVTVDKVESFTDPVKVGAFEYSRATVSFKLRNAMAWVDTEEVKQMVSNLKPEFQDTKLLVLKEGKWLVASNEDIRASKMAAQMQNKAQSNTTETGFLASIKKLFSGGLLGGNPLIGRWSSNVMGVVTINFEFDGDYMISNGQKVKVRYEVEDQTVTVYAENASVGLIFTVIDSDTVSINSGFMDVKLKRTK